MPRSMFLVVALAVALLAAACQSSVDTTTSMAESPLLTLPPATTPPTSSTTTTLAPVERLTSPEYQHPELYLLRDAAAWAARRLGGERMSAALRTSIEMRQGRDIRPLIYYAVMNGKEAIPVIDGCIASRLRFSAVTRGNEHDYLQEMLIALRFGQDLDASDVPPSELNFM